MSVVVIEELAAGAKDKADIKSLSLIRDVLIARTAKREKLTVVSDNKDFPLIHRYYEFDWVSGKEFFNN
ncbi:MAG: hypothetical protein ACREEM_40050 [Blastocatellia bacterium]